jgi:hypothetical protein
MATSVAEGKRPREDGDPAPDASHVSEPVDVLKGYDPTDDPEALLRDYNALQVEIEALPQPFRRRQLAKLYSSVPLLLDFITDQAEIAACVVFDIETTREVDKKSTPIDQMRVSVVCAAIVPFDASGSRASSDESDWIKLELWSDEERQVPRGAPLSPFLGPLLAATRVSVGYNSIAFDLEVLRKYLEPGHYDIIMQRHLDILLELEQAFGRRHKLGDILQANGLASKTGSGLDAVRYWQTGMYAQLAEYCMVDVVRTAELALRPVIHLPSTSPASTLNGTLTRRLWQLSGQPTASMIQGTAVWFDARKGLITASVSGGLLGVHGAFESREAAYDRLFAELNPESRHSSQSSELDTERRAAMARGNAREADARRYYSRVTGRVVETSGLHLVPAIGDHRGGIVGASPDGFSMAPEGDGEDKLSLEFKVPKRGTKGWLSDSYILQCQLQMAATDTHASHFVRLLEDTRGKGSVEVNIVRIDRDDSLLRHVLLMLTEIYDEARSGDDEPPERNTRQEVMLRSMLRSCREERVGEEDVFRVR